MNRKYFGTDGVRGTVGQSPMTPDLVLRLGYAAGKVLAGKASHPAVLIGKDTRISGYMIEAALEAGFSAAGVDVLLCGPLPTPGVAYLARALRLSAGVVISASHNPYADNGIKFFSGDGYKLPDAVESDIERALEAPIGCNESAQLGKARRMDDAAGRYIEFCKSSFPADLDLRGLRIVVDCAHGAAYNVAPHVFHELGAEVVPIGVSPDGFNINDMFGASSPQQLEAAVRLQKADFGIALDGDGDRLLMADAAGHALRRRPAALRDRQASLGQGKGGGRGRHADDQFRARAGVREAGRCLRAREGGRPLRAGTAAREGLAARRRELRAPAVPGQAHHGRRHRLRAAGAGRAARRRGRRSRRSPPTSSCIRRCW